MKRFIESIEPRLMMDAGRIDPTFAPAVSTHVATIDLPNGFDESGGIATYPDGRVLVGGFHSGSAQNPSLAILARYNADGSLDKTFASGGIMANNPRGARQINDVALLPDGSIIAVARIGNSAVLQHFSSTGRLDKNFGNGGTLSPGTSYLSPLRIDSGGRIFVASRKDLFVFTSKGKPDTTFANAGKFTLATTATVTDGGISDIGFDNTGRIYLAQFYSGVDADTHLGIGGVYPIRLDHNGTIDTTYLANTSQGHGGQQIQFAVAPDGSMVVQEAGFLKRLDPNGVDITPPTTDGRGVNTYELFNFHRDLDLDFEFDLRGDMLQQPDGKVLMRGYYVNRHESLYRHVVVRLTSDLKFDTSFGSGGISLPDFPAGNGFMRSFALSPDGNVVFASDTDDLGGPRIAVGRIATGEGPTAIASARNLTRATDGSQIINVTYRDAQPIDTTTLDNRDLRISGPHQFVRTAKFISFTSAQNGRVISAVYKLIGSLDSWDANDNGTYSIRLYDNAVADVNGHGNAVKNLGSFEVRI